MTVAELNRSDRARFAEALDGIFEGARWVAERAWERRPFSCLEQLHASMAAEVANATADEQLALLRAHPDLGSRARMSDDSEGEQSRAGLDRLNQDTVDRLQRLNALYREKFGFPFLLAVKGRTADDVLAALERRLGAEREVELVEALIQVYRIAGFRLNDRIRS
jgi:2-oxo-4-hydroxy-4-carboxy-5-ureidoimidazoline decarboxylase